MKTFYDFLLEAPQTPPASPAAGSPPPSPGSPPSSASPPSPALGGGPTPLGGGGGLPGGIGGGLPDMASPAGGPSPGGPTGPVSIKKTKALNVFDALEKLINNSGQNNSKMVK